MTAVFALGIDPGPTTGIALLYLDAPVLADGTSVFQCNAATAPWLLSALLNSRHGIAGGRTRGGIEAFVPGRGAGARRNTGSATRDLARELRKVAEDAGMVLAVRNAAMVKPWATDVRLTRAGLLKLVPGMPHARDGLRHALYTAVHDCGLRDPLSRRTS